MPPPIWSAGAATLRAYGTAGVPVLVVPSLINRSTILDLAPDRSFMRALADAGLAAYLLDWDAPGEQERAYDTAAYVARILLPALREVARRHGAPAALVGYCMGGTLAVAPAVLAPDLVARLVLLAAPWDFHADNAGPRALLGMMRPVLETFLLAQGCAPVDLLQALFAALDPSLVGRKFRAYAALDPASDEAHRFVALEDWLNDGVPLALGVARDCLFGWYGDNAPLRKTWQVDGTAIDPARIAMPALVVVPSQDRIVPPRSALALAEALPRAEVRQVPLGHIGMIAGGTARAAVTEPVVAWLQGRGSA
jgi:polyhydroxyalkanoate synthase